MILQKSQNWQKSPQKVFSAISPFGDLHRSVSFWWNGPHFTFNPCEINVCVKNPGTVPTTAMATILAEEAPSFMLVKMVLTSSDEYSYRKINMKSNNNHNFIIFGTVCQATSWQLMPTNPQDFVQCGLKQYYKIGSEMKNITFHFFSL